MVVVVQSVGKRQCYLMLPPTFPCLPYCFQIGEAGQWVEVTVGGEEEEKGGGREEEEGEEQGQVLLWDRQTDFRQFSFGLWRLACHCTHTTTWRTGGGGQDPLPL